jgi:hypothetical protein
VYRLFYTSPASAPAPSPEKPAANIIKEHLSYVKYPWDAAAKKDLAICASFFIHLSASKKSR